MTTSMSASASVAVQIGYAFGHLSVEPSTVEMAVGDNLKWILASEADEVGEFAIFLHGGPFQKLDFHDKVPRGEVREIDAGSATQPGEYKYDVIVRAPSGQQLADDDPYIIVGPRDW